MTSFISRQFFGFSKIGHGFPTSHGEIPLIAGFFFPGNPIYKWMGTGGSPILGNLHWIHFERSVRRDNYTK
jgi:hypothetical protein